MEGEITSSFVIASVLLGVVSIVIAWPILLVLDHLLRPRVLDWWARQNEKRAVARAKQLARFYHSNVDTITDIRLLVVKKFQTTTFLLLWSQAFNLTVLAIVVQYEDAKDIFVPYITGPRPGLLILLLGSALSILFVAIMTHLSAKREMRARTPEEYRVEVVERVSGILSAAGLNADEIEDWLIRLRLVPSGAPAQP
jgi:hypothetical protein